ncbi:hypothetical protein J31TS4_24830 [Paenibacillus sp. J31TS4]|uniref:peptidoglycan DD-metalloendopeptidase family protein n=1 Tax=Paenibacillus sp. J31TS4 TaxID=2807195 RepID=UPI001B0A5006|nr:M23 family metallopeptidase [Paenibacillus sp. J31TS4]GIP39203.1 hypothetical protein J31TS4_24830 [Paenibacillus sp. J31TS4]
MEETNSKRGRQSRAPGYGGQIGWAGGSPHHAASSRTQGEAGSARTPSGSRREEAGGEHSVSGSSYTEGVPPRAAGGPSREASGSPRGASGPSREASGQAPAGAGPDYPGDRRAGSQTGGSLLRRLDGAERRESRGPSGWAGQGGGAAQPGSGYPAANAAAGGRPIDRPESRPPLAGGRGWNGPQPPSGYGSRPPWLDEASDPRWRDPEFVWRMKERQFFEQLAARPVGGDGGPHPPAPGGGKKLLPIRLLLSLALFLSAAAVLRYDLPGAERARLWVQTALTKEMGFDTAAAWYERRFGSIPSFLPAFRQNNREAKEAAAKSAIRFAAPVSGKLASVYTKEKPYVVLETAPHASVRSVETGRISFAGTREETGYTIVVQHAGGLQSTYGYLTPGSWEASDWLNAGAVIGTPASAAGAAPRLYFSVSRDGQPLNPQDVVAFD